METPTITEYCPEEEYFSFNSGSETELTIDDGPIGSKTEFSDRYLNSSTAASSFKLAGCESAFCPQNVKDICKALLAVCRYSAIKCGLSNGGNSDDGENVDDGRSSNRQNAILKSFDEICFAVSELTSKNRMKLSANNSFERERDGMGSMGSPFQFNYLYSETMNNEAAYQIYKEICCSLSDRVSGSRQSGGVEKCVENGKLRSAPGGGGGGCGCASTSGGGGGCNKKESDKCGDKKKSDKCGDKKKSDKCGDKNKSDKCGDKKKSDKCDDKKKSDKCDDKKKSDECDDNKNSDECDDNKNSDQGDGDEDECAQDGEADPAEMTCFIDSYYLDICKMLQVQETTRCELARKRQMAAAAAKAALAARPKPPKRPPPPPLPPTPQCRSTRSIRSAASSGASSIPSAVASSCATSAAASPAPSSPAVVIKSVRELGPNSLFIRWLAKDKLNIQGYEIYVDGVLTNRYSHPSFSAAVINDVDTSSQHNIMVSAISLTESGSGDNKPVCEKKKCVRI